MSCSCSWRGGRQLGIRCLSDEIHERLRAACMLWHNSKGEALYGLHQGPAYIQTNLIRSPKMASDGLLLHRSQGHQWQHGS